MSILSPFSAGFVYGSTQRVRGYLYRDGEAGVRPAWGDPIAQHSSFERLYVHEPCGFWLDCLPDWDELLSKPTSFFDTKSGCEVHEQPVWDLREPLSQERTPQEERTTEAIRAKSTDGDCDSWRFELLAWYCDAHRHRERDYGIHLTKTGIAKSGAEIMRHSASSGAAMSRRSAVIIAVYALYCHELCHAYIEDLACVLEFALGVDRYCSVTKAFRGHIITEEAICNTFAFSCLNEFLELSDWAKTPAGALEKQRQWHTEFSRLPYQPEPEPRFNSDDMLGAVERWMRSQPRGYSDFLASKGSVAQNALLWVNMARLLAQIYGFREQHAVSDSLELLFGVHVPDIVQELEIQARIPYASSRNTDVLKNVKFHDRGIFSYGWPLHVHI